MAPDTDGGELSGSEEGALPLPRAHRISGGVEVDELGTDPLDPTDPAADETTLAALTLGDQGPEARRTFDLVNPTSVALTVGALGSLAVLLGWWGVLGRFLAGTALGAFLLAFWRRRKVPGPPHNVQVAIDTGTDRFTWAKPSWGKDPTRYNIEGFDGESWLGIHEHLATTTLIEHPSTTTPAITRWRITASNEYGTGKPSHEIDPTEKTRSEPSIEESENDEGTKGVERG